MRNKKILNLIALFFIHISMVVHAADFPRVWVNSNDKARILTNINDHQWAANLKAQLEARVDPWSSRHVNDPEFLLSRLPKTWGDNNPNYTGADLREKDTANHIPYTTSGTAPIPTLHRSDDYIPRNADGKSYDYPGLENMPAYNTEPYFGLTLKVSGTNTTEFVAYPARHLRSLYTEVMMLGVDSAVLYYLTGKAEYAQLTADILHAFIEPLAYMTPTQTEKSHSNGILITNFLRDARITTPNFPIMYDFIHDFLALNGTTVFDAVTKTRVAFNDNNAQAVFAKLADYVLSHGLTNTNWSILEGPGALNNITVLKDDTVRNALFKTFYEDGTQNHDAFSWSLNEFTPENLWPESLGYSAGVNYRMLRMMSVIDRNQDLFNQDVFAVSPKMFEGAFVYENLEYPTKESLRFGDAKRDRHIIDKLYATVLHIADDKNLTDYKQRASGALAYFYNEKGGFSPQIEDESLGYTSPLQLLWGHHFDLANAQEPKKESALHVSHAGVMMQRNYNTTNVLAYGMMYYTGGASYVHANASGLDFEVYGAGNIMGHDFGSSLYGSDIHEKYAKYHAAHNTVIVNGMAKPGNGWDGIMDDTQLISAEPASYQTPISDDFSFSCQQLDDTVNNNEQQRCIGMMRTSNTSGYYLDIFRSKSNSYNQYSDYVYHNVGDSTTITDMADANISLTNTPERYKNDLSIYPGWQFFEHTKTTESLSNNIKVRFNLDSINRYMNAYIIGGDGPKEVSLALGPETPDALNGYDRKKTQIMTIRRQGSAWNHPYMVVYEPAFSPNSTIKDTQVIRRDGKVVGAQIWSEVDNQKIFDIIFVNDSINAVFEDEARGIRFEGQFGVIRTITENGTSDVQLYIGSGKSLTMGELNLDTSDHNDDKKNAFAHYNNVSGVNVSPIINEPYQEPENEQDITYDIGKEYNWDAGSENVSFKQVEQSVANGMLTMVLNADNSDPYARLTNANIDGNVFTKVELRVKNNTSDGDWRMYFDPAGSAGEGGNSVSFTTPTDNEWYIVTVDMSADADWSNMIDSIRLDMAPNVSGTVELDYVRIIKNTGPDRLEGDNSDGDNSEGDNTDDDSSGGDNTGGDNSGGDNTDGDNSDGDNSGGDNTDDDNSGGDNTDGDNSDGDNSDGDNSDGDNSDGDNTADESPDKSNDNASGGSLSYLIIVILGLFSATRKTLWRQLY